MKLLLATSLLSISLAAAQQPSKNEIIAALVKASAFTHDHLSVRGGYLYAWSGDLKLREAEGIPDADTFWVQPPGTPLVGEAFVDAYEATKDAKILGYVKEAALALAQRQLHSGGWYYSAHFAGKEGENKFYTHDLNWTPTPNPVPEKAASQPGGWDVWRTRRYEANLTTLDDDTTQGALRFLMRADQVLEFKEPRIHQAVERGLNALLISQYPNGAWSTNWDRLHTVPPSAQDYPVKSASYPADYPRTWPKDFTGCYVLNDDLIADVLHTLLRGWSVYKDDRYLAGAVKAGEFLLLAQMPEPQPAWCQQYDKNMQPVWGRAFEVTAISSRESETAIEALLLLARATGDKRWLATIPKALSYLRKSLRSDGKLARYYEMKTNTPLYFQRKKGGGHELTYSDANPSDNYGFIIDPILDDLDAEYQRVSAMPKPGGPRPLKAMPAELAKQAAEIIAALDSRGAWVVHGEKMKHNKGIPESGIIFSEVFAKNVTTLCNALGFGQRAPLSQ